MPHGILNVGEKYTDITNIHGMYFFRIAGKCTITIAGSTAEGMRGGIYSDERNGDDDLLFRNRKIKLYTPRANNINNPPWLPLHDNEDYTGSFFVVQDDNFPGYVKLSLMEGNCTNTCILPTTMVRNEAISNII